MLRCALAETVVEPGKCAFSNGDRDWLDNVESKAVAPDEDAAKIVELKLAPSTGVAPGSIASPSALAETTMASALRLPNDEALDRGAALHAMLEKIEWIEDWQPNEAMLKSIAQRTAARRSNKWAQQQAHTFLHMVEQATVRKLLSRGGRDPEQLKLYREHPFARLTNNAVQRGVIDRLEVEFANGQPQRAIVIDFKTDDITPDQAQATAEKYRLQLAVYREAAASLLGLAPAQIKMTVLFVGIDEAIELR